VKTVYFEWDQWNVQKNEIKHGVSCLEAESCFYDRELHIYHDLKHSTWREKRYILYGKSMENRVLMLAFTFRKGRIRIITARPASEKERGVYEEKTPRNPGL
jgi:uncharacterized DUF497 family protein